MYGKKIYNKLDEILTDLNKNEKVKKIKKLKQEILNDKDLSDIITKYKSNVNNYNDEIIEVKRKIIEHPKVREYRDLENELYFLVLEVNKRLNSLIDKKGCSNESN